MNKEIWMDDAAKKRANTSGVGKSNNWRASEASEPLSYHVN